MPRRRTTHEDTGAPGTLVADIRARSLPLRDPRDLDPLLERVGDARCVLLGEASHGTRDYYTWRAEISKRLITEKGFSFVAVEGDWPDCYRVNRFVKGYPASGDDALDVLRAFERWPTWMWANEEVADFARWLRDHNEALPNDRQAGFYGLDVYSLWESLEELTGHLGRHGSEAADAVHRVARCFDRYGGDEQEYAWATMTGRTCEEAVRELARAIGARGPADPGDGREAAFAAEQNALVLKNAEAYYRTMVRSDSESWNVRDRHMAETLARLLHLHGPQAKAIVWEHNTHIGDARHTDMADDGMVNVGQLAREQYGDDSVVLVGFGSHRGSVIAGDRWGAPMRRMAVPEARPDSWEDLLHRAGGDAMFLFDRDGLPPAWYEWRGHRAIGVVYRPAFEALGNYVPTVLPRRYDAFLFIDRSEALRPLHLREPDRREVAETYPSGM